MCQNIHMHALMSKIIIDNEHNHKTNTKSKSAC